MTITLSDSEVSKLQKLASLRSGAKSSLDKKEFRTKANPDSYYRHLLGLKCEFACAKLFKSVIDETFSWGDNNDPDLYLPDGRSVQVKGKFSKTKFKGFTCRTTSLDEFKADVGILCFEGATRNQIDISGWFDKDTFVSHSEVYEFEWGNKRALVSSHLKDINLLIDELESSEKVLSKKNIDLLFKEIFGKKLPASLKSMTVSEANLYLDSIDHLVQKAKKDLFNLTSI